MICLGVESTAHTFGIGIIRDDGKILVNEKSVYKPKVGGGIIPHEAAKHHQEFKEYVLENALKKSNLKIEDIDILAYSAGPGLPPTLLVGANFAIELSKKYKKPLIPVNHCIAHIEIGKLTTGVKDPVVLYLSGGNTQVIAFTEGKYRIFGETQDIPIGNALDTLAREIGLKSPGGPEIEKLAKDGKYINLPYVVKGMDLSFSGITTEAIKKFKQNIPKDDVCYSFQETCFSMLTEVTERAMAHTDKNELLLVGGVASNKRLQEMLKIMCEERNAKFYVVPKEYSGDQGVMIAWLGTLIQKSKQRRKLEKDLIKPNWRTDEVDISWI